MDVLLGRFVGIVGKLREVRGALMVRFDENHGALDAVVKGLSVCVPPIQANQVLSMCLCDFIHFHRAWPLSMLLV